jgi:hypothetical protein
MTRVGVLACGRMAHIAGVWGPIIEPSVDKGGLAAAQTRMTDLRLTHVWDIDRRLADAFGHKYGATVVDEYGDMVGKVDGIILDDFDSCLHFKDLARPYLEAGVPMFINRPFALSLADAGQIIALGQKHDTPILSGSSFEYAPELKEIRRQVAAATPISGYCVANSSTDYASHGVHGLFFAYACVGGGIRSVAYQTRDWRSSGGTLRIEHEGRDGGLPFTGSVKETANDCGRFSLCGQQGFDTTVETNTAFWVAIVQAMQKLFQTRRMPQTYEQLYEKTQLFLAGFKSHVECGGAPVPIDQIGDWQAPLLNPDPYPEGFFA